MDKRALTFWVVTWSACTAAASPEPQAHRVSAPSKGVDISMYKKPNPEEIKRRLTREQFEVTQNSGTEAPFKNPLWDNHEAGIYVDVVTGEPLFSSNDKFNSGTGWPSFSRALEPELVVEKRDSSHGMTRVEVRSKVGDSHLGHLFDDGPAPTGQRYCINSASLRFIPATELAQEGYAQYAGAFPEVKSTMATNTNTNLETVILAGGCFWGMEEIIRKIPGVTGTEVGYSGGNFDNPKYPDVHTGRTGHAEAVKVTFDPSKLSFETLLEKWFFKMHDPTTMNRQGNDIGTQYRSAIFYTSEAQKKTAEAVKARVDASGKWKKPIVTEISAAGPFFLAEDYHQDYLEKNPGGYTCHFMRE